jgi:FkbM family methyltransferase
MNVYIQIGTNDGNDNFRKLVLETAPDLVILIEPNPALRPLIEQNYRGIPGVHILTRAIYYNDDTEVELYIPAIGGQEGTPASNGHIFTHVNYSLVPMNDWGNKADMCKIRARTISFDGLCTQFGITEIAYLQMDTEGFDSEIIRMIDFDKYCIRAIRYEKWGFDSKEFTKFSGDKYAQMGVAGMDYVRELLVGRGYVLTDVRDEDGNDVLAILS